MIIKVKLGDKGQLVIPKVVRESIGLDASQPALLEVKDKFVELRPLPSGDIVKMAADRAKKHGGDVSKWVYGDLLYEREF